MSLVALIEAKPRDPATGTVSTLRLVCNARERANYFGQQWMPALLTLPGAETALGFDGNNFGQGATPTVSEIVFIAAETLAPWAAKMWRSAEVKLWIAPWPAGNSDPADGAFTVEFTGLADLLTVDEDGQARLTILDPGQKLRASVTTRTFGSTGDALLDSPDAVRANKGQAVPIGWGELLKKPARLVDQANLIYLFAGNPATSVQGFYDGGAAFTLGVARASLAALRANVPARGAVDYCLDAGGLFLARPWSAPKYPFTVDFTSGSTKPADIAAAVVASRTTLAFKAGTVAAFNAVEDGASQLYVNDTAMTLAGALDQIFGGLGAWWKLTLAGTIDARRWAFAGAAVKTFPSWQIKSIRRDAVVMPTAKRTLGFARIGQVHSEGDIAQALLAENIAGQINYGTQVGGTSKPIPHRVRTRGFQAVMPGGDIHLGLWNEDTQVNISNVTTSYCVAHQRTDLTWGVDYFNILNNTIQTRDFWLNGTQAIGDRDAMAIRLQQIQDTFSGTALIVYGWDEPSVGRLQPNLLGQMLRAGASMAVYGSAKLSSRTAYLLVGVANGSEGNGAEYLSGVGDLSKAFIDVAFTITNGILSIAGKTPSTAEDLAYTSGVSIEALKPAQAAADVTADNAPSVTGEVTFDITADSAGTPDAGQLPLARRYTAFVGLTNVSASTNWALSSVSAGLALSVNNAVSSSDRGVLTWTSGGNGTAVLTATLPSGAVVVRNLTFKQTNAPPPTSGGGGSGGGGGGTGGTTASSAIIPNAGSATYPTSGTVLIVSVAGPGTTVALRAPLAVKVTRNGPTGDFGAAAKWQRRLAGSGTWIDLPSGEVNTFMAPNYEAEVGYEPPVYSMFAGSLTVNTSITGLAAGDYEFQFLTRTYGSGSATRSRSFNGTLSASAS